MADDATLEVTTLVAVNASRESVMDYEVVEQDLCSSFRRLILRRECLRIPSEVISHNQNILYATFRRF